MLGFRVPKSNICVDYWSGESSQIRFLTNAHYNRIQNISNVKDRIFMSPFSLWYLKEILKLSLNGDVSSLTLNERHMIQERRGPGKNEKVFYVTLIDADHCPGSVMYFFEGDFGQVLCTGAFRYSLNMMANPTLSALVKSKSLDILNVDNSFIAEHCNFPTRKRVISETLRKLKAFPSHKIIICTGNLGKYDLLVAIAKGLKEKISVGYTWMKIAEKLGYSDFFTVEETRILTHNTEESSFKDLKELKKKCGPSITFITTTSTWNMNTENMAEEYRNLALNVIPHCDHSNHQELYEFIDALRPNCIVPIIKSSSDQCRDSNNEQTHSIPEKIFLLLKSVRPRNSKPEKTTSGEPVVILDRVDNAEDRRKPKPVSKEENRATVNTSEVCMKTLPKRGDLEKGQDQANKQKETDEYLKMLNYWSDQGITGDTFRHPDLKGVYDYK